VAAKYYIIRLEMAGFGLFETEKKVFHLNFLFSSLFSFLLHFFFFIETMNEVSKESAFLVTNASGRHINLLNDNESHQSTVLSPSSSEISEENANNDSSVTQNQSSSKRKYHCTEPGCTKSFTTRYFK
jgi:hypothetical protein